MKTRPICSSPFVGPPRFSGQGPIGSVLLVGLHFFSKTAPKDFLHEVRGPKSKKSDTARFSKKNLILAILALLGSKYPKIEVFGHLLENGSKDFLDFLHESSSL